MDSLNAYTRSFIFLIRPSLFQQPWSSGPPSEYKLNMPDSPFSGGSIRMEVSNPEASAKNGELVLCNINMDSSGGDF